jgi:hypothetical protein
LSVAGFGVVSVSIIMTGMWARWARNSRRIWHAARSADGRIRPPADLGDPLRVLL